MADNFDNIPAESIWTSPDGRKFVFCETEYHDDVTRERIDTEFCDYRGRSIGFRVIRASRTIHMRTEDQRRGGGVCKPEDLGFHFTAQVQILKNDVHFGSSQETKRFRTEADREAWIEATIAARRKAAAKQDAKRAVTRSNAAR